MSKQKENDDKDKKNKKDKDKPFTLEDIDKFDCCRSLKDEIIKQMKAKAAEEARLARLEERRKKREEDEKNKSKTKPRKCCWGCLTCCFRKKKDDTDDEVEEEEEKEEKKVKKKKKKKKKPKLEAMFGEGCNLPSCGPGIKNPDADRRVCRTGDDSDSDGALQEAYRNYDEPPCGKNVCPNVGEASHAARDLRDGLGSRRPPKPRKTCGPGKEEPPEEQSTCCSGGPNKMKPPFGRSRPPVSCQVPSCKYNSTDNKIVCKWADHRPPECPRTEPVPVETRRKCPAH